MLEGLALGYLAGLATPFIAGVLIYRWAIVQPWRRRSTHQKEPRHAPRDRTSQPRV